MFRVKHDCHYVIDLSSLTKMSFASYPFVLSR